MPCTGEEKTNEKAKQKEGEIPAYGDYETSFTALYYSDGLGNAVACDAYNHAMSML